VLPGGQPVALPEERPSGLLGGPEDDGQARNDS